MYYLHYKYHLIIQYKSFTCNNQQFFRAGTDDILHLIFCDSHGVGDGQKAFLCYCRRVQYLQIFGELIELTNTIDIQHGKKVKLLLNR